MSVSASRPSASRSPTRQSPVGLSGTILASGGPLPFKCNDRESLPCRHSSRSAPNTRPEIFCCRCRATLISVSTLIFPFCPVPAPTGAGLFFPLARVNCLIELRSLAVLRFRFGLKLEMLGKRLADDCCLACHLAPRRIVKPPLQLARDCDANVYRLSNAHFRASC